MAHKSKYTVIVLDTISSHYNEVEVSQDVYNEFRRGKWRIDKNEDKHHANEIPFSSLIGGEDGNFENFHEFISDEGIPEKIVRDKMLTESLHKAIDSLNESERALIRAIFFDGLNDYQYADRIGVSHQSINKRKKTILKKLKKFFEDVGC